MNDELLNKIHVEMLESMGAALGIVAAAMARQVDPIQFHIDLEAQIEASKQFQSIPKLAVRLASHALAAVEAERMVQNPTKR